LLKLFNRTADGHEKHTRFEQWIHGRNK